MNEPDLNEIYGKQTSGFCAALVMHSLIHAQTLGTNHTIRNISMQTQTHIPNVVGEYFF